MRTRTRPLPSYLQRWFDARTGKTYLRFRKRGHKTVTLPQPVGSEDFWLAYKAALAGGKKEIGAERSAAGSVSASIAAYYVSFNWTGAGLSDGTRKKRRRYLEHFREKYGDWPLRQLNENFVTAYLQTMKPQPARNHVKALRGWLRHANHDVTRNIKLPTAKSTKRRSWPPEEQAKYEARYAIGTMARLAFALANYTGAGRTEISRIGRHHLVDGEIAIPARQKTGVPTTIPLHPELKAIIEATPITGFSTLLVNRAGKAFTPDALSDQFREWCNEAGVAKDLSLHGLRHAMGDALAETGANANEIASVLAHASVRSALHYTQGADRKLMAGNAMRRLIARPKPARSGNEGVSVENPPQTLGDEKA